MIRPLSAFERAAVVSNDYAPFNVVVAVHLKNAPSPDNLKIALKILQQNHQLLRAHIQVESKNLWFQENPSPSEIPLKVVPREDNNSWKSVVELEMERPLSKSSSPLIHAVYVITNSQAELILTAHHALIDGAAGEYLIDQLLTICAGGQPTQVSNVSIRNQNELLPPSHSGINKLIQLITFGVSQLVGELSYRIKNINKRVPLVQHGGKGKILTTTVSKELTSRLSFRARRERVTLNSVLNAAQLLAVNKILYAGKDAAMQTFSFADLRPYLNPPIPQETLGGWVTLFRIPINVTGIMDFWELSKTLHSKITSSLRRGDKFNAFLTSEGLLKMMTRMDKFRFGTSAINYSGVIQINPQYGNTQVESVHGFVSAYDLAPEFSSQARIFQGQIIWDFIYLDSDMDETTASKLVQEIISIVENAVV